MASQKYTFHPSTGALYAGDHTEDDATKLGHVPMVAQYEINKELKAKSIKINDTDYTTQYVASNDDRTQIFDPVLAQTAKQIQNNNYNNLIAQNNPLMADANRQNLQHLQQIKLIPKILGMPEFYFHLHNMFTENDVAQLEARQPLTDVYEQQGPIGRYAKTPDSDLQFAEIKYDLKKFPIRIPTPIEDIFRTLLNPHQTKINQITWARGKKHNEEALKQLKTITLTKNVSKINSLTPGDFHDANSTVGEITDIIADHLTTHHSLLTYFATGTKVFRKLVENTWTFNVAGPRPNRVIQGVFDFPGIENAKIVVDPQMDASAPNTMYAVDKMNGAQYGQGPVLSKTYDDEERDAMVVKNTEFFQYLIVNAKNVIVNNNVSFDRKFAVKLAIAP